MTPKKQPDASHIESDALNSTERQKAAKKREVAATNRAGKIAVGRMSDAERRRAYQQGVRDTLRDLKGRMRAEQHFTYEPPIVEHVEVPAQVTNGAFYPAHKTPVIVSPGQWKERNGIALPTKE